MQRCGVAKAEGMGMDRGLAVGNFFFLGRRRTCDRFVQGRKPPESSPTHPHTHPHNPHAVARIISIFFFFLSCLVTLNPLPHSLAHFPYKPNPFSSIRHRVKPSSHTHPYRPTGME